LLALALTVAFWQTWLRNERSSFRSLVASAKAALPADTSAPKVKQLKVLNDPKPPRFVESPSEPRRRRSTTGLFLLEGPEGLKEAPERLKTVEELYATEECVARHADLFERAEKSRIAVQARE
jgi:tRNA G18 (ribose-2'-O)-methylase SpoU